MDLQQFFDHWKLKEHPFQAEEALNDAVYNRMLKEAITHPDFTKIYGDPANPGTTIVFGEKGSGKTAIRLMIQRKLDDFNQSRQSDRVWIVSYEELNPMLDRLSRYLKSNDGEKVMQSIRLADHQDAILSLAVTGLVDSVLGANDKESIKVLKKMDSQKRTNLAALALLYDQPKHGHAAERWDRLLRILRMKSSLDRARHGTFFFLAALVAVVGGVGWSLQPSADILWIAATLAGGVAATLMGFWWLVRDWGNKQLGRQLAREIRVVVREKGGRARSLWDFKQLDKAAPLFPAKIDQDSRFDLTGRFLNIVSELGYSSMVVLLDRVDEPVLVNGDARRMKSLVWPMMNNKFLQQEGIGIKMLLPIELSHMLVSEDVEFKRKARLDKQNVVNPLKWTGTTLYDLCSWRFKNCQKSEGGELIPLEDIFDEDVESKYLIDALDQMHQPRDAFKFLYAVVLEHCRNTPGSSEDYQISRATLDYVRREQSQRVVDLYRGVASN
jgi:hypothetical protein